MKLVAGWLALLCAAAPCGGQGTDAAHRRLPVMPVVDSVTLISPVAAPELLLPAVAPPARAPRDLRDIARSDAWLHAGSSAAIQFMGYTGLRGLEVSRGTALLSSVAVTVMTGLGKELYDAHRGGDASFRDLGWDLIGLGAGILLATFGNP